MTRSDGFTIKKAMQVFVIGIVLFSETTLGKFILLNALNFWNSQHASEVELHSPPDLMNFKTNERVFGAGLMRDTSSQKSIYPDPCFATTQNIPSEPFNPSPHINIYVENKFAVCFKKS